MYYCITTLENKAVSGLTSFFLLLWFWLIETSSHRRLELTVLLRQSHKWGISSLPTKHDFFALKFGRVANPTTSLCLCSRQTALLFGQPVNVRFHSESLGEAQEQSNVMSKFHDFMCFCPGVPSSAVSPARPQDHRNNTSDNFFFFGQRE